MDLFAPKPARIIWGESEKLQFRFFDEPEVTESDSPDEDDGDGDSEVGFEESGAQITSLVAGMTLLTLALF